MAELIFWNTLDDQAALEAHPDVVAAPLGGLRFLPAVHRNGLLAEDSGEVRLSSGLLDRLTTSGTVEAWFSVLDPSERFATNAGLQHPDLAFGVGLEVDQLTVIAELGFGADGQEILLEDLSVPVDDLKAAHVALTWDAAGIDGTDTTAALYVDGARVASSNAASTRGWTPGVPDPEDIVLGEWGANFTSMIIDDLRIWDGARTDFSDRVFPGGMGTFVEGTDGPDVLPATAERELFDGGAGNDLVDYSASPEGVTARLWDRESDFGHAAGDKLENIEGIRGSAFKDVLVGSNVSDDALLGGAGDDLLYGLAGRDALSGEAGNDRLLGGQDPDVLDGGAGVDTVLYTGSPYGVTVRLWNGTGQHGHAEGDVLRGIEAATGSAHRDVLVGTNTGGETLNGADGEDFLYGLAGADLLIGARGDGDMLTGGAGADVFRFAPYYDGDDVVLDFEPRSDRLEIGFDWSDSGRAFFFRHDFDDITLTDTPDGVQISLVGADLWPVWGTLTLAGVSAAELGPDDFL